MYKALFVIHVILRNVLDSAMPPLHLGYDSLKLFDREKEKDVFEVTWIAWNSSTLICLSFELGS